MMLTLNYKCALLFLAIAIFSPCSSFECTHLCVVKDRNILPGNCNYTYSIDTFSQEADKYSKSDTTVTFFSGHHNLTRIWKWKNIENVTFRVNGGSEVVIDCSPDDNNGFIFENIVNLNMSGLRLIGCGSNWTIRNSFKGITRKVLSALSFINGSQLTLTYVNVSDAKAAGLYIYNVAGDITVDSVTVKRAFTKNDSIAMGGSVVLYDHDIYSNLTIKNCTFISSGYDIKKTCSKNTSTVHSAGLVLITGSPKLLINISGTHLSKNKGCNGGNMGLLLFSIPANCTIPQVIIHNSTFDGGSSLYGGGLYVSFEMVFLYHFPAIPPNCSKIFSIYNSTFSNNVAFFSGGGIVIQWQEKYGLHYILDAFINNSIFVNNSLGHKANGGLALHYRTYIVTGRNPHLVTKFRVNLYVVKCCFFNHSPRVSPLLSSESSVILAKSVPYLAIQGIDITSNNCTAILAIDSTLVFSGSSIITKNFAQSGAGIRFCSGALMYLKPHTELVITKNSANDTGGGILVNSKCLVNVPICFYQYTEYTQWKTVNVTISDNHAGKAGENLFGGSIDYCYLLYIRRDSENFMKQLHIPNNSMTVSSISSNPQHVCFKDNNTCGKNRSISIYPGELKVFEVQVVGQLNGSVPGTVKADQNGTAVYNDQIVQTVNSKMGGNVTYIIFSLSHETSTGSLRLEVDLATDSSTYEYIHPLSPAVIKVTFKSCPLGFINHRKKYKKSVRFACKCNQFSGIIEKCSIDNKTITKYNGSWVGVFEDHLATSKHCPLDYCDPNVTIINSTNITLDQDRQCRYNRNGLLCGSCRKGFSLIFGTSECREKCSNWWLLLVIPFALAGIFLVFIITYLNLTVTTGTVCGLIFYANVIQDYSVLLLQEHPVPVLSQVLQIFIAWLNLDLGIPTCFYDGMQAFGKTALQAVFPVYIWLVSAVIIFLSNRYISITRLVGQNAVKVLATLILLSYSKMLRVTIGTLNQAIITVHVNNTKIHKLRWIIDGNVPYFNPQDHLILIIMAIIFLILTLPFALSLLCVRHVFSLSNCCRIFSWVNKLKPFFDAYTGPCKDSARFWTGLLLLTRLFLLLVHAIYSNNLILPFLTNVAICLVLSAIMISLNGVYKSWYLNVLECSFILNIGLLFTILVVLHTEQTWGTVFVSHLLVSVALLTFFGILAFHIYLKCSGFQWVKKRFLSRFRRDFDIQSMHYERLEEETVGDERSPSIEASDRLIHFPPIDYQSRVYERSRYLSSNK